MKKHKLFEYNLYRSQSFMKGILAIQTLFMLMQINNVTL